MVTACGRMPLLQLLSLRPTKVDIDVIVSWPGSHLEILGILQTYPILKGNPCYIEKKKTCLEPVTGGLSL